MKSNPAVWFEIYVNDLERAKNFYETVLSLKLNPLPTPDHMQEQMKMLAFPSDMEALGASGALVKMEGLEAGGSSTLIYFGSSDCSIEEAKINGAGGKVFKSKQSIGEYGFIVLAYDTEGNMFGIHSMK